MVRITAIKINLTYFKLAFFTLVLLCLVFIIKSTFLPQLNAQSIINSINSEFFENAMGNTMISNKSESNFNLKSSMNMLVNKSVNLLVGFDITKPQTVLACQMPYIDTYDQTVETMIADFSSLSGINEAGEDVIKKPAGDSGEAEVTPKESVVSEKGITLINETNYKIDLNAMLNSPLKIKQAKNIPQVLIYHTHTCESYTSSPKYKYTPSDNDRTSDPDFNMVAIGEQFAQTLRKKYGLNVVHDKTIHDADEYNRAYSKSEKTLQGYIKKYPGISLIIDLHRDAADLNGKKLRVTKTIDGVPAAQAMVVVGSDGRGLSHPNWRENLKLGVKLVNKSNQLYPGLLRGVNLKLGRFNQFYSPNALLIEVGANGNTLDEALNSTNYLSRVIAEVLNEAK